MQAADGELRVPQAMRGKVGEILAITDRVCLGHLDGEYAELCRRLVAKLARKRPSPLARGALPTWAAGAIYAVGSNNSLRSQPGPSPKRRPPERAPRRAEEHDGRQGQVDP